MFFRKVKNSLISIIKAKIIGMKIDEYQFFIPRVPPVNFLACKLPSFFSWGKIAFYFGTPIKFEQR